MAAPVNQLWRWDFEELAFEILPRERADIVSLRTRRAARRARGDGPPPARTLTVATYWEAILTDLQRLLTIRWSGDLPPGHRDTWLFLAACAMSWLAPPAALRREVHSLAREVGGWTESEANSRLSTVLRRAEEAARGCTVEWKGQRVDPRYMFRALTVVEWLGITPAEMRDAGLRVLVDRDRRRELAAQRHEAYRRRTGIRARAAYDAARADAAQATGATKPWEIEGISRATWYRRHTTG